MGRLRKLLRARPVLALWLIAAALAVRAIVPQGYMIVPGKTLTVAMCSAAGATALTVDVPMRSGKADQGQERKLQDSACPFGGLSHAAMAGADPVLLVQAIAFVLARGIAPTSTPDIAALPRLQPPLRGPPSFT